jgi:spermidine synthase
MTASHARDFLHRLSLCALFFLSGASALIYELVWQRLLNLVFGVSTLSVSAVLAAFMGGLALGGFLFGRRADRTARPLRIYACLEALIGAAGLILPWAFQQIHALYPWFYTRIQPGPLSSTLLHFFLAALVLMGPATLMGATMPLMGRLMLSRHRSVPGAFSLLYAVNTLGAVLGAALTGFVLLRSLGMQQTLWLAACVNFVVAVVALLVDRASPHAAAPAAEPSAALPARTQANAFSEITVLGLAGVTGAVSMGLEVMWTRILGILTSNSAYGFALLLTVMLVGLASGSALCLWWRRFAGDNWLRLAMCQGALACLTLVSLPFFRTAPAWLDRWCDGSSALRVFVGELALTAGALLMPAILMGLSLPLLAAELCREPKHFGRCLGRLYSTNTIGCVLGVCVTGFVLIPRSGIDRTAAVLGAATLVVAGVCCVRSSRLSRSPRLVGGLTMLAGAVACCLILPQGFYLKSAVLAPRQLLFYAEGDNATVSVLQESDGTRSISVDGQPVAGTVGTSVIDQKMLAHLPLLLHPEPHKALTVGFGSGGTSYSMSLHGVDVHCVEIEPQVPAAAALFESENHGVLGYPRFRLIVDDARGWLHVAPPAYDVIVTDCTNIQYRSNGDLYTVDYFRLMKDRLTANGIAAAWVPANGIGDRDLKTLLRSFWEVFPHTSLWYMDSLPTDFLIVVGSPAPLHLDLDVLRQRMSESAVAADLAEVGYTDPYRLLHTLLVSEDSMGAYLESGPLNTDDRPVLSYSSYGATFKSTIAANLSRLLAYRTEPARHVGRATSETLLLRHYAASNELILGHIAHFAGAEEAAQVHYARAAQLLPEDMAIQQLARFAYGAARHP